MSLERQQELRHLAEYILRKCVAMVESDDRAIGMLVEARKLLAAVETYGEVTKP